MNRRLLLALYWLLAVCCFGLDRFTKWYALNYLDGEQRLTSFLSFDLVMNRGISWSFFHSMNQVVFIALGCVIGAIIMILAVHTVVRWQEDENIIGEVLTLSGAISNLIDRIWFGGVIDFIVVTFGPFNWPVFNVADICIVVGISMMVLYHYGRS